MYKNIEEYLKSLSDKYGENIDIKYRNCDYSIDNRIPKVLHSLYSVISEAKFPFGEIFTIEKALSQSSKNPFTPNWFVFGKDNYFSFWICSFAEDEEGLNFTYWDHESGNEIDGAVWDNFISFFDEIQEDYEE
ncbi:hypothetical protein acsn021_30810 [Anaerocolumna cellulosilytica]|uniref:Uncharacterized protein n=1 Tax=Anaerocolumna cellulosilytica TaxID=433286 RepID=A0A6S6R845_9FIRM|nr:hypothetical protein [Anaerocolumna cellulosilytica]MBB5198180.1 hypothetical protein [Anaerocolumna cellulosilytica]BCJ95512.1 hypothetical protein acsn021_30810 [Anaerocolumna cellulosilytica]